MKAINKINFLIGALFLMTGCAVTDVDKTVDFKSYNTYQWGPSEVKVTNPIYNSDLIGKNIRNTVNQELAKRGMREDSVNGDFIISYQTYTEKKEQTMANHYQPFGFYPYGFFSYRFFPFAYGFPYGWNSRPVTTTVTEGTLIIDITDRKTNDLVWRGSVKGNVDSVSSLQNQIRKGIKAILKKYPVKPGDIVQQDAVII